MYKAKSTCRTFKMIVVRLVAKKRKKYGGFILVSVLRGTASRLSGSPFKGLVYGPQLFHHDQETAGTIAQK